MKVHLYIDRLVLDGVAVANRNALQLAVETELARLIGERGIGTAAQIGNVPHVTAPPIAADRPLGTSIAGAVHRAIGGGRR